MKEEKNSFFKHNQRGIKCSLHSEIQQCRSGCRLFTTATQRLSKLVRIFLHWERKESIHLRYIETINKMIKRTKHLVRGIITTGVDFHHHGDDISEITHHSDSQITQLTYKLYWRSLSSHLQKENIFLCFTIYLFLLSKSNQEPEWPLMTRNLARETHWFEANPLGSSSYDGKLQFVWHIKYKKCINNTLSWSVTDITIYISLTSSFQSQNILTGW